MAEANKPVLVLPPAPKQLDEATVKWLDEVLRRIERYVQAKIDQIA
jgi:hypothetical protein